MRLHTFTQRLSPTVAIENSSYSNWPGRAWSLRTGLVPEPSEDVSLFSSIIWLGYELVVLCRMAPSLSIVGHVTCASPLGG